MKKIVFLLSFTLLLNFSSFAGGFKLALQGQKQIGMGNIGAGFAQDAATIYYNPAGMAFITNQVNFGMTGLFPSISFRERSTNAITNAVNQMFTPFSFYANASLTKKLKVGLGVYTPFGSGVRYPTDWAGRYTLHEIELQTVYFQPSLSLQLGNNLSIGGGFIYSYGNVLLNKDLPLQSVKNADVANAELTGEGQGMGYNIGTYFKLGSRFSGGITYHSRVDMKLEDGDAIFSNIPQALASSFPTQNYFDAEIALPSELALGFSYKISEPVTIAVDYNRTFWKSYDSLGFDYAVNSTSLSDAKSPRLYENASCIRVGAQVKAHRDIDVRGALFFDETPVQDGYVAPELPDNDKIGLSLGATFRIDQRFHIDVSLLYENVGAREQRNIETGLEGTFHTKVIAPGIGLTYLFTKRTERRKNY
jgi:long-chain fatty acid transport protein